VSDVVASSLALTLPWPPSVNSYWQPFVVPMTQPEIARFRATGIPPRPRVTMTLTGRARTFRFQVEALVCKKYGIKPPLLNQPLRLDVTLRPPDRRTRDIDNNLKGLLDALTHAQVWTDDSVIEEMAVTKNRPTRGGAVEVIITTLGPLLDAQQVPSDPTDEEGLF
jgi:crossover junction endodeoxyribonuclease RusA